MTEVGTIHEMAVAGYESWNATSSASVNGNAGANEKAQRRWDGGESDWDGRVLGDVDVLRDV